MQSGRHGGAASNAAGLAVISRGRPAILLIVAFTIAASVLPVAPQLASASTSTSTSTTASVRPVAGGWAEAAKAWLGPVAHWYRPVTVRLEPRPAPGAFSMNLFSRGDFVHQQTEYWCVAAAVQTMANIIDDGAPDRSRRLQERLHFMGRRLDREGDEYWRELAGQDRWRRGLHGLGLDDWAGVLNAKGHGPYTVDRALTRKQAIRMAARAIRMTGKPVGLVVWRGAHAWVMSGFTATADPAHSDGFRVKRVVIQDPWYPDVSSIWGASRPPGSRLPVAALARDYLPYDRPGRRHPKRDGKFLLILPSLPAGVRVR